VFVRSFSNGIVVVNPTPEAASTDLGADYRTDDGVVVRSVTVNPHSGLILTTP
jgi:hypothetical protein